MEQTDEITMSKIESINPLTSKNSHPFCFPRDSGCIFVLSSCSEGTAALGLHLQDLVIREVSGLAPGGRRGRTLPPDAVGKTVRRNHQPTESLDHTIEGFRSEDGQNDQRHQQRQSQNTASSTP